MAHQNLTLDQRLDAYYQQINTVILSRQNPISGLLPASTAVNAHGDYTDAWVRDNVYSILAVWGLAMAYRQADTNPGRAYELEHSVIKLMRGLLFAMMRQAPKVEAFKITQAPMDALHAKYNTTNGATVVADDGWGHLQIDATSIFLLMLAQMTASGLAIVYNQDEVNFIQNLVYYIGRAYRTPDYGIWERGNKINHGSPELNASSIGMAKAALTAMDGFNLFGIKGDDASVIHVMPDEIARCRMTLESLLPRESSSKEVDAALLSVIGYPAFAIESRELVDRTRNKIVDLLQGNYGCKRFLRDGHQTVLEDTTRLHYEPTELKAFEHIECEWPLFFTYLALDAIFRGDRSQAEDYLAKLESLAIEQDGIKLLPEVYFVPEELVEAEKADPHSQIREPNDNLPLVWAQSLYYLAQMLNDGLITVADLDPLNQHSRTGYVRRATVQIALLAEDESLQERLAAYNIPTETLQEIAPIQVRPARELGLAYTQLGKNDKLSLTGRPQRLLRSLSTSKVFKFQKDTFIFLPTFLERDRFYLTLDYHFLVSNIKSELSYTHRHWRQLGRPLVTLLITHDMLNKGMDALLKLVQEFQDGMCGEVPVKLGPLNQLMLTASRAKLDFLPDFDAVAYTEIAFYKPYLQHESTQTKTLSSLEEFMLEREDDEQVLVKRLQKSRNLYEQIEILATLTRLQGLMFDTGMSDSPIESVRVGRLIEEVYNKASRGDADGMPYWSIVRRAAGLLDKLDASFADAVTEILVRQKQVAVGLAYSEEALISQPMPPAELLEKLRQFCREDIRDRVLTQEILIYLSLLMKSDPAQFKGLITLRVGYFIVLLTNDLAQEQGVTQDEAYERLMQLSPFEIKSRLAQMLMGYEQRNRSVFQQESLKLGVQEAQIDWIVPINEPEEPQDWLRHRQVEGARGSVPTDFYPSVWKLLNHCKGLVIGDKLERRNRLDRELLEEMTAGETNFALKVEHLLNKIVAPEYRSANIEALMELAAIVQNNPDIRFEEYIVLDILIGHAVRLAWLDQYPDHLDRYDEYKTAAWKSFYTLSSYECANFVAKALQFLTRLGEMAAV